MMFLSDAVTRIAGEYFYLDKITTLWDDILYNNLAKEGDVDYSNGKKPIFMLQRIIEMVANNNDIDKLVAKISLYIRIKDNIKYNVNANLNLDKLLIGLGEIE